MIDGDRQLRFELLIFDIQALYPSVSPGKGRCRVRFKVNGLSGGFQTSI